jgi:calcineurin-like phosphoesterase family protein
MRLNVDLTQKGNKNVFFTSDFHLFHNNVLRFDNRPFEDVYEMHHVIEENWNEIVQENDIVIYLGDLSFARREDKASVDAMLSRLKGEIHFVMGNHDKFDEIRKMTRFQTVSDYLEVRVKQWESELKIVETLFCCMHYPIYSWNKSHHGSYMVHGHCHGNLHHGEDASFYWNRRVIDAGCMLHDYKPISYSKVIEKLSHVVLPKLTRTIE